MIADQGPIGQVPYGGRWNKRQFYCPQGQHGYYAKDDGGSYVRNCHRHSHPGTGVWAGEIWRPDRPRTRRSMGEQGNDTPRKGGSHE